MGESPALTAVAELLEEAVQREQGRGTVLEARKAIYLADAEVCACLPASLPASLPPCLPACLPVCLHERVGWRAAVHTPRPAPLPAPPSPRPAHLTCVYPPPPPLCLPCHPTPTKGLVVRERADSGDLADHKLPYIQVGAHA